MINSQYYFLQASKYGHVNILKLLIENNAQINAKTSTDACTALYTAAFYGKKDACDILIKNKADVNMRTNNGCTALFAGKHKYKTNVIKCKFFN